MASYPGALKTWADKVDLTDFMTAGILNDDVMDEIIAVQTELGTDPAGAEATVKARLDAMISDAAYAAGWNGDTTHAASKNAVYNKIETLGGAPTLLAYNCKVQGESISLSDTTWTELDETTLTDLRFTMDAQGKDFKLYGFIRASGATYTAHLRLYNVTDGVGYGEITHTGDTDNTWVLSSSFTLPDGEKVYVIQGKNISGLCTVRSAMILGVD